MAAEGGHIDLMLATGSATIGFPPSWEILDPPLFVIGSRIQDFPEGTPTSKWGRHPIICPNFPEFPKFGYVDSPLTRLKLGFYC